MRKVLLFAVFLVLGILVGSAWWFLYTAQGARFFLGSLSRVAPVEITAGKVTGRLADRLELDNLQVRIPQDSISLSSAKASLSWRPLRVLSGAVAVNELRLHGVKIIDNRPVSKEPLRIEWPRVSGFLAGLFGWIKEFRADGILYERLGEDEFTIDRLRCSIFWHHGMVSINNLIFDSALLSARGSVEAGFFTALLRADLRLVLPDEPGGFTRVTVKMDLKQARPPEQLLGAISLAAQGGPGKQVMLAGRVGLAESEVSLRDIRLTHSDFDGSVSGEAAIAFAAEDFYLQLKTRINDMRRKEGAGSDVVLAGDLQASGSAGSYQGSFTLSGRSVSAQRRPWQAANLGGRFEGSTEALNLTIEKGEWLGGTVKGDARMAWNEGVRIAASLQGRQFDPARLNPEWSGSINVNLDLDVTRTTADRLEGRVEGHFPKSTLRGRALTAEVKAYFRDDSYRLDRLELHGKGFDIRAQGVLDKRLNFDVAVGDLSGLIPAAEGCAFGSGWLRWKNGEASGSLTGGGSGVSAKGIKIERTKFSARLENGGAGVVDVSIRSRGLAYERVRLDTADLTVSGRRDNHTAAINLSTAHAQLHLSLQGGLRERAWEGTINQFNGKDRMGAWGLVSPAGLKMSEKRLVLEALRLTSARGEAASAEADVFFNPVRGSFDGSWKALDLSRLQPFISRGTVDGSTSGNVAVRWPNGSGSDRRVEGQMTLEGRYREEDLLLPVKGRASINWDGRGLSNRWDISTGTEGSMTAVLSAAGPPAMALPKKAAVTATWNAVDVSLFRPFLPSAVAVKGLLSGKIDGELLPDGMVSMAGRTEINKGVVGWQPGNGMMTAAIQTGSATFSWTGAALRGDLSLALTGYGKVKGHFSLPLPARLPASFVPDGPVTMALSGQIREQGMITALFPGLAQETKGLLDVDLNAAGTWQAPQLTGNLVLKDAGAYLPAAGIRVQNVRAEAVFAGNSLKISRIRAESGGGWIEASGNVHLGKGQALRYDGTLRGEAFQALNLPDVRAYASPRITFNGDAKLLSARGEITIPRMSIYGAKGDNVVRPSPDIVIVDARQEERKPLPIGLDIQIRVTLGEKVLIEARGIDARLAGAIDLNIAGIDKITARGKISVVEGGYRAYGIRLVISRGTITFVGPVERPVLDILAMRKTDDVAAGVEVTGSARNPVVSLWSNRPMSDSDKLAYIVLGHRLSPAESGQSALFAGGPGGFDAGGGPTLTSDARRRLGLEAPGAAQEEAARAVVGFGRYLAPGFYVGIGRSLLTNENLVTLRYTLSKRWDVESKLGGVTGMDLFYNIEFD